MSKELLFIEEQEPPKISVVGEVKSGFTTPVGKSKALERARLFLPLIEEANKHVTPGACDPVIIGEDGMDVDVDGSYVQMDVAVGILEEKGDEN